MLHIAKNICTKMSYMLVLLILITLPKPTARTNANQSGMLDQPGAGSVHHQPPASAWEWEISVMCPEGVLCFLSMGPNQFRLTSVAVALADAQDHYQDQHQEQHQDATISNVVNTL